MRRCRAVSVASVRRWRTGCACLLALLCLSRCAPARPSPGPKLPVLPDLRQVQVSGAGLTLGEAQQVALTPAQLLQRVESLLAAEQPGTAQRLVQRYPDVALETLRAPTLQPAVPGALQTVALAYDAQCSRGPEAEHWAAVVQARLANPQRYHAYDTWRRIFFEQLQQGRLAQALALPAPAGPGLLLHLEALALRGVALLLHERPGEADDVLAQALTLSRASQPCQAVQQLLWRSAAQRRQQQLAEASATWEEAVRLASSLGPAAAPLPDPLFWERADSLRPAATPWPAAVQQWLQQHPLPLSPLLRAALSQAPAGGGRDDSGPLEALLWYSIGHWHVQRQEAQAALVALRRAEALAGDDTARDLLWLVQARALHQLGQPDAATLLLTGLVQPLERPVARPALALLGVLHVQRQHLRQGLTLLRRAVEEAQGPTWPGQGEAEADLGLAYLLLGDAAAGLRWLRTAQQRFAASADVEALTHCLTNEMHYLEHAGRRAEASAVRQRLRQLEAATSTAGSPQG
ncbi:MAG: hypothetical protein AB7N91_04125 [Candidatus Tectimicrobiota bacterium]